MKEAKLPKTLPEEEIRVIFKNLPWDLRLLQVDGKNHFICKMPPTVS